MPSHVIKWETVKRQVVQAMCLSKQQTLQCDFIHSEKFRAAYLALLAAVAENRHPSDVLEEWMQHAERIITSWDIRRAGKLLEIAELPLRGYTPGGRLVATYDEKGDWVLIY